VAHILGGIRLVDDFAQLRIESDERPLVFDVRPWLLGPAERESLPHTWDVTSDSIAALVAARLAADELVLLKSTLSAGNGSANELAAAGLVDAHFPRVCGSLDVRIVNLRDVNLGNVNLDDGEFAECRLLGQVPWRQGAQVR
jgi:hypothetical protein